MNGIDIITKKYLRAEVAATNVGLHHYGSDFFMNIYGGDMLEICKNKIIEVMDFPKPGIGFKDITRFLICRYVGSLSR